MARPTRLAFLVPSTLPHLFTTVRSFTLIKLICLPSSTTPVFFLPSIRRCQSESVSTMSSSAASPPPNEDQPRAEMPTYMIYGTAWKKESTAELVYKAIKAGFRAIDTAHMKTHYNEPGTGEGVRRAVAEGLVKRSDLWIQTKFTPGDAAFADTKQYRTLASQVHASVAESLRQLSTPDQDPAYIDCLILHQPMDSYNDSVEVWHAMMSHVHSGAVRTLGISNARIRDLEELEERFIGPPEIKIVQNRFIRERTGGWDHKVRSWCLDHGAEYQGFWTLTGNRGVWERGFATEEEPHLSVAALADMAKISRATAWYVLLSKMGVTVLNGTTSEKHMSDDLAGLSTVVASVPPDDLRRFTDACSDLHVGIRR
ncbi:NADP-dependent oxidoreductase domain-containing protein [Cercophora scortea]|uniref:NADP-dependent oxidoreductase domain-containing protein n=1 Tax=Cercophora scortea TaxID=314031 RepID=A0AAE0IA16_9PEZI|nr:NADP-dependent oxidoreductase domain-containing protein [Cercophora scortea]